MQQKLVTEARLQYASLWLVIACCKMYSAVVELIDSDYNTFFHRVTNRDAKTSEREEANYKRHFQ